MSDNGRRYSENTPKNMLKRYGDISMIFSKRRRNGNISIYGATP